MNGESPVDFEIIPGQNVEVKTEFMQMLEDLAVSMVMAPELVNSRDNEQTATHITMTNTQFLIDIFERQQKYKDIISEIATKIYQNEYGTNDEIEIELPPPMMLNFSNISQMLSVANDIIQNITVMKLGANQMDEALKAEFTGKLMEYYFKTFLPMEDINKLYDEAKVELAKERQEDQSQMMGAMGGAPEGGDMGGGQPQM
jgi:truncated hemoglobin YjbI